MYLLQFGHYLSAQDRRVDRDDSSQTKQKRENNKITHSVCSIQQQQQQNATVHHRIVGKRAR